METSAGQMASHGKGAEEAGDDSQIEDGGVSHLFTPSGPEDGAQEESGDISDAGKGAGA